tara:strand:- start:1867 stop:3507 length:1641 start_codon:yes stop_codon:yes gene_type:complete
MTAYSRAYLGEMFTSAADPMARVENHVTVNTADGYAYIEGFVASLYSKAPALAVGPDAKGGGNPEVMEAVANRFLYDKMVVAERALRYSLIYPYSFYKLAPKENDSLLDSVDIRAVHPWDIIVDFDAEEWTESRFVGHRYFLPMGAAKQKFPSIKWNSMVKEEYLNTRLEGGARDEYGHSQSATGLLDGSQLLSYVEIFEIYDLMNDKLIFYSPSAVRAKKIIDVADPIPFRKADGSPCPPLVPVYLSYAPDQPLRGFSSMARVYDQLWEINNMRTVWANGLRRDARIYVTRRGAIDQEGASILAENRDMSIVELDVPPETDARTALVPLEGNRFSPDYQIYKAEIRADLDRGTVMAPFTRGTATNASATEVAALTQYSANEIGRMARFFHRSLEMVGEVYQSLIYHLIMTSDEDRKEVVLVDRDPVVLTRKQFEGSFKFAFADQASTPIASAIKRSAVTQLLPVLMDLGVPAPEILSYLVNVFDLPEEFIVEQMEAAPGVEGMPSGATEQVPLQEAAIPKGGGEEARAIRGAAQRDMASALIDQS